MYSSIQYFTEKVIPKIEKKLENLCRIQPSSKALIVRVPSTESYIIKYYDTRVKRSAIW